MSVHESFKYQCNQCEYKATLKQYLKNHKMSVHENIKFSCNQCESKFTWKGHLQRHIPNCSAGCDPQPTAKQCPQKPTTNCRPFGKNASQGP